MKEANTVQTVLKELCVGDQFAWPKFFDLLKRGRCPEVREIKDMRAQIKYFEKMRKTAFDDLTAESKKGNLFASAALGMLYILNFGVKKHKDNPAKGLELIQKAAKEGNLLGRYLLGQLYYTGIEEHKTFKQDFAAAKQCYEEGASKKYALCFEALGDMYRKGEGCNKDFGKSRECYLQAASLGSVSAFNVCHQDPEGENLVNPFVYYTPKNLEFTYKMASIKRPTATKGNIRYETGGVEVTITYTGDLNVGPSSSLKKEIGEDACSWLHVVRKHNYIEPESHKGGAWDQDAYSVLLGSLVNYFLSRAVADVISDFDAHLADALAKAKTQQASAAVPRTSQPGAAQAYPGGFFQGQNAQPYVAQQPLLVSEAQMQQVWQSMHQNPVFAQQVVMLHQQFFNAPAQQPQYMQPQQQVPQYPNSGQPPIPSRTSSGNK